MTISDRWRRDVAYVPLGRMSKSAFLAAHLDVASNLDTAAQDAVMTAIATRDGGLLDDAFLLRSVLDARPIDTNILADLLAQDWHCKHEDIARMLQRRRDPRTVGALRGGVRHVPSCLEWDENRALAVKCLHALEDIGTPEAKQALREFADDPNPVVSSTAARMVARDRNPVGPQSV